MDAKQLGKFINEQRKQLGMTQAELAERLHVTDKAISRWERGVGLPDINNIESLAESLEVSVLELMQAKIDDEAHISKEEAEEVLLDTIQLSKTTQNIFHLFGGIILVIFICISLLLFFASLSMNKIPLNVISFILGLAAWGIPIWHIAFARTKKTTIAIIMSFGCVLLSLIVQFYEVARRVHLSDWSALLDTIDFLTIIVIFLSFMTIVLNMLMFVISKYKK